jgi:hypothetical protein
MEAFKLLEKIKEFSKERKELHSKFEDNPELLEQIAEEYGEDKQDWYKYEFAYLLNLIEKLDLDKIKSELIKPTDEDSQDIIEDVEESNKKHIVLYRDEFRAYAWEQYSKILGFPINETEVKVFVNKIE